MGENMKVNFTAFILTICGVFIIILASVGVKIYQDKENRHIEYIKSNLKSSANQCIIDNVCNSKDITIKDLIDNGYISDELKTDLKDFSTNSYVVKDTLEVYLIEKLYN